jgi:hypothetical protein
MRIASILLRLPEDRRDADHSLPFSRPFETTEASTR